MAENKGTVSLQPNCLAATVLTVPFRELRNMLALRPNCELCDKDLPPESIEAMICSFECTFCAACAGGHFKGVCPNCGGNFSPRPIRPQALLAKAPASTERVLKPHP